MKKRYYITAKEGKATLLPPTDKKTILNVSYKNIIKLIVPKEYKTVYCNNNQLTSLVLPKGIKHFFCDNNKLTSLELPYGIKTVSCDIDVELINLNRKRTEVTLYT